MNRLLLDGFKKVKFSIEIDVRDQVCLKIDERLRNKIQMKFFSVAQVMDQFSAIKGQIWKESGLNEWGF